MATLAEYCSDSDLSLPSGHGFTTDELLGFRRRGSSACESWLEGRYRMPLPDYDDEPGTPDVVRQAAAQYASHFAHLVLGLQNMLDDGTGVAGFLSSADKLMELYGIGKRSLPREVITDEDITFGTDPLGENEYELASSFRKIDPDTVEIEGFENGRDFRVEYRGRNRGWILTRLTSEIEDGAEVSYEYTYHPNSLEIQDGIEPGSLVLFR